MSLTTVLKSATNSRRRPPIAEMRHPFLYVLTTAFMWTCILGGLYLLATA